MGKIIFVSGVHGVGKGTFCQQLSDEFGWHHYSCSQLIKDNSAYVEQGKQVSNADKNQVVLLEALKRIPDDIFLLDGHFCLLNENSEVLELDMSVFEKMAPSLIINIQCDENEIYKRMKKRDGKSLTISSLKELQRTEIKLFNKFCEKNDLDKIFFNSMMNPMPIIDSLRCKFI